MNKIAFNDLAAQYAHLKEDIDSGIQRVIEGCHFISGPEVTELEKALCDYTSAKYCVTVSNGTDALLMPLMAKGIGPGDAVFVPAFTFVATAEVASLCGATPVFCDVNEDTFNIDSASLRQKIEAVLKEGKLSPRAVIAVDLFGQPADFTVLEPLCREYGLFLVEDAAQGFGGRIGDRKACTFGDVSATSFFPAKPLGCYGDGGAIFTDDKELYETLCSIRIHGKGSDKYENVRVGLNARLDTLQAAILMPKLHAFDAENEVRNHAAQKYSELLAGILEIPLVRDGFTSSWAQYTLKVKLPEQRVALMDRLKAAGVPSMVYYPRPLHLQGVYKDLCYKKGDLPVSESLCDRVMSLPMHGYITDETIEYICEAVKASY